MSTDPADAHPLVDASEMLNAAESGWAHAMGLRFVKATAEEVVAEWVVGPNHLQSYGIVHGGVHCGVIESVASVGGALWALPQGLLVVGLDNHTSFLRAVRQGTLCARCTPLFRGRSTQMWEAHVTDEQGKTVATGRVRLLCRPVDADLAGLPATLPQHD